MKTRTLQAGERSPMRLGVKAAPGDAPVMARLEHASFLETVLTARDVQQDYQATREAFTDLDVHVVHVPFRLDNGAELDVAHRDAEHREQSLASWAASMRLAHDLEARWLVVHPGGIVSGSIAQDGEVRARALELTTKALERLADEYGREKILMENMPSHYHRADGTTDRSLTGQGLVHFYGWRGSMAGICLDTAHAMLTPGGMTTLSTFLERAAGEIRHLHLGDAVPPDGEGLPLGAGRIDWHRVREGIAEVEERNGEVSAVPEVHGGHVADGEGFQQALTFAQAHLQSLTS